MSRKTKPTRKKAVARNFKSEPPERSDHQIPPQIEAEQKQRKKREALFERSKKLLRCFPDAEEYLRVGMDILTVFVESKAVATPDQGYVFTDKCTMERLGRMIVEHLTPCIEVLSKLALCGDRNAMRSAFDFSVHLAKIVDLVSQIYPDCQSGTGINPALVYASRKWTKDAEFAALKRDSVLKLGEKSSSQPWKPATRIVLDFMQMARGIRGAMFVDEKFFQCYSHLFPEKTLDSYLVHQCGFSDDQLIYKDLPDFTWETRKFWWKEALKPFLNKPETLHFVRCYQPSFFKDLSDATSERKDYQIKDELKKRCRAALFGLAPSTCLPQLA